MGREQKHHGREVKGPVGELNSTSYQKHLERKCSDFLEFSGSLISGEVGKAIREEKGEGVDWAGSRPKVLWEMVLRN